MVTANSHVGFAVLQVVKSFSTTYNATTMIGGTLSPTGTRSDRL